MSVLKIRGADGKWRSIPSIKGEDGRIETHADRHKIGGEDQLTPSMIGAAEADHTHAPFDCGAAPEIHTHTPAEIGAAEAVHNHDDRYHTKEYLDNQLASKALRNLAGTDDLEAGVSPLNSGQLYLVYE